MPVARAEPRVASARLAAGRSARPAARSTSRTRSHPLLLPSRARRAGGHDSRSELPDASRAHARGDPPRLPGARARPRAPRRPRSSCRRSSPPARSSGGSACRADRISVCPPGAPDWTPRDGAAGATATSCSSARSSRARTSAGCSTRTSGSSSRRRSACRELRARRARPPSDAGPWLDRIARPPLARRASATSATSTRRIAATLYEGARLLVQPSFDEGFGIPVLEAMTLGVPVVAANRGALPEVLGDAGPARRPRGRRRARRGHRADARRRRRSPRACARDGRRRARASSAGTRTAPRCDVYEAAIAHRAARGRGLTCASASTRASSAATPTGVGRYLGGLLQRVGRRRAAPAATSSSSTRPSRSRVTLDAPPLRHARRRRAAAARGGNRSQLPARRRARSPRRLLRAGLHRAARLARADRRRHPRPVVRRAPRVVSARAKGCGAGWLTRQSAARARAVITISEFSRRELDRAPRRRRGARSTSFRPA